ncbi:MAG: hypothetical protein NZM12_14225, partial [Steroidobacteraceae bacterium]|nr:hypothetical protein [Steroidobacteraceae bacterium]
NLTRLRRTARCVEADLTAPLPQAVQAEFFWAQDRYDRILLDAPCSGTGVIRRHPDIKLLRRESDIEKFVSVQKALLRRCFDLLRPGGRLLYVTCSVLKAENDRLVSEFLAAEPHARSEPLQWPAGAPPDLVTQSCGAQLLPGNQAGTDGFYYALISNVAKAQHS